MFYMLKTKSGWSVELTIDWNQWMVGFNYLTRPWHCWNVFVGPLRIGGYR